MTSNVEGIEDEDALNRDVGEGEDRLAVAVEIVGVADVHQIHELGLVREAARGDARQIGDEDLLEGRAGRAGGGHAVALDHQELDDR